jgi:hypothetical protein
MFSAKKCHLCGKWLSKTGLCTNCRGEGTDETKAAIHSGRNAMWSVIREERDYPAAMSLPEIGPIDFPWSKKGMGVKHILYRRMQQDASRKDINKFSPEETCDKIAEVIALGKISFVSNSKIAISHAGFIAVIAKPKAGSRNAWLITGYEKSR